MSHDAGSWDMHHVQMCHMSRASISAIGGLGDGGVTEEEEEEEEGVYSRSDGGVKGG